ncbi:uncharacterized protein LOC108427483 isoform X2 [Pygocentrus nattereri]|uniref:uncharacterized protein LOC108427483 isoform X2 n=1 Tax=Pygocentrus nattereri TaxID=42514 RepID=UPI00189118E6|nr:uncharacterized protein LOC108427483 isoform X2 [Pygocentrus nattereri]
MCVCVVCLYLLSGAEADQGKNIICLPDLKKLIMEDWKSYIKAGGHYGPYQAENKNVLDSLLVGFHHCYIRFDKIKLLFQSDPTINAIMRFLDAKKYNEAKVLWLVRLNLISEDCTFKTSKVINVLSEVKDHLPMLQELVCSRDHFSESGAIHGAADRLQESILCEFQPYGDVMTLGKYGDPCLILVKINGWMDTAPPLYIKDKYERTFELQFLLLWRNQGLIKHMVVHCNLVDRWVLDDNSQSVAPHNDFRFDTACYVNITQPGHSNVGAPVAEEGLRPGASVWNWSPVGNGDQLM